MSDNLTIAAAPPSMDEQAERLIELGVHTLANLPATQLRAAARAATAQDTCWSSTRSARQRPP